MNATSQPVAAPLVGRTEGDDEGRAEQRSLESLLRRLVATPPLSHLELCELAADAGLDADAVGWLAAQPLAPLLLYPELVTERVVRALRQMMPLVAERLGERFTAECRRFARRGLRESRFSRDLAGAFLLAWRRGRVGNGWPAWSFDLARHETATVLVAASEDDPEEDGSEPLDARSRLCLSRATRLMRYGHPVQRYWEDRSRPLPTEPSPQRVLLYRAADDVVRCLELSPFAYALTRRLRSRRDLETCVSGACTEMNHVLDDPTRDEIAVLLDDYAERGLLHHVKTNGA